MPSLIILTGKTASGKDTIKSALFNKYPNLKRVITTTSRLPRHNEQDGNDYFFLTRKEFEDKIENGEFAEYVEYGGNLYGTYKKELEKALSFDLIWKIDPSRAGEIRDFIKRAFPPSVAEQLVNRIVVIYISTPAEIILQRLKKRGLSGEEIQKRMADDQKTWDKYKNSYDFVVENTFGQLDKTIDKIVSIVD